MIPLGAHLVLVQRGDSAWKITAAILGNGSRWRELVTANPQKPTAMSGNFLTLVEGEKLHTPLSWPDLAAVHAPSGGDAAGLGTPDVGALPFGWSSNDLKIVSSLASVWGVAPEDLLVTWYEESGLQPHNITPLGSSAPDGRKNYEYAGLIAGLSSVWDANKNARVYVIDSSLGWPPGTWAKIVTQTPIATQLQAIAQIWDKLFKTYLHGETVGQFADRLGVSRAAVIHALNFLPARVAGLQSADAALTKDPENFYLSNAGPKFQNWGLDVNRDGKISLSDLDTHGRTKLAELEGSSLGPIVAEAKSAQPPGDLATLFAPISNEWQNLTGRAPVMTVGYSPQQLAASGGGGGLLLAAGLLAALIILGRKKR
jgi:hypothetical protein